MAEGGRFEPSGPFESRLFRDFEAFVILPTDERWLFDCGSTFGRAIGRRPFENTTAGVRPLHVFGSTFDPSSGSFATSSSIAAGISGVIDPAHVAVLW